MPIKRASIDWENLTINIVLEVVYISENGTRMTLIKRIITDNICANLSNLWHPCSAFFIFEQALRNVHIQINML